MMATKARGETLDVTDIVNLTVQFKGPDGNPINTDSLPQVSIIQPSGLVLLASSSTGVVQLATGKYQFAFTIPYGGPYGVYNDIWSATINGFYIESTLSFVVVKTDVPSINSDGYVTLGQDPGFQYSQQAIKNINKMLKMLKARLNSAGKVPIKDEYGNTIYTDCDIYSIETLTTFLGMALSYFNSIPYFTFFQFDDDSFVAQFGEILVQGATIFAMASQALIERGLEYQISDNGINFTPPTVSDMLNTQYSSILNLHWDQVKMIKNSMRPGALGLGVFSMSSGINPAYRRLRHLRERRII